MPKLKPKVLIITTYEYLPLHNPKSTGEAQHWYQNDNLTEFLPIPGMYGGAFDANTPDGSYEGVFHNKAGDECLMVSGMGQTNAATSLMAACLSDQLDLTQTYLLVAGIAGGNPNHTTLGSVAWANWVVAGDLANLVPLQELPSDTFLYPLFHLGCDAPWTTADSPGFSTGTEVFPLNQSLAQHAHALSKNAKLGQQTDAVRGYCANYDQPAAQGTPSVLRGDVVAANFFYHGNILGQWAEWWMRQWTEDWIANNSDCGLQRGTYTTTVMEDIAFVTAARRLGQAGRIDTNRLMILRGAGNFDRPSPGQSTMASLQESDDVEIAFDLALANLYAAGSLVVQDILSNWKSWKDHPPS